MDKVEARRKKAQQLKKSKDNGGEDKTSSPNVKKSSKTDSADATEKLTQADLNWKNGLYPVDRLGIMSQLGGIPENATLEERRQMLKDLIEKNEKRKKIKNVILKRCTF